MSKINLEFFEILSSNQKKFKTPYKIGSVLKDDQAMKAAIFEGYKGLGSVSPNPLVGCSILSSQKRLLSLGYHRAYGKEHAEIHAIKKIIPSLSSSELKILAQDSKISKNSKKIQKIIKNLSPLKDTHLFVTLEPCSVRGKQESCARILSMLPFSSITYGILDPHPKVSGNGIKILKFSNKNVKSIKNLKIVKQIKELTEVFLHNIKYKKTFVVLKIATSLDGKIALKPSNQKTKEKSLLGLNQKQIYRKQKKIDSVKRNWITNLRARKYSHFLRGSYDATLIGVNTLLVDNPKLNIRHELFPGKENKIVIIDPKGKSISLLKKLNLSSIHKPKNIFIAVNKSNRLNQRNVKYNIIYCPLFKQNPLDSICLLGLDMDLDLNFLSKELFKRSIYSLYVEGGARVHSGYFRQSQWNRVYQFFSPTLLGSSRSLSWTSQFGIKKMNQKIKIKNIKVMFFGNDLLISGVS